MFTHTTQRSSELNNQQNILLCCFCTMHCDIIMQHQPMKCELLNFSVFDVFYVFRTVLRMNALGLTHAEDIRK